MYVSGVDARVRAFNRIVYGATAIALSQRGEEQCAMSSMRGGFYGVGAFTRFWVGVATFTEIPMVLVASIDITETPLAEIARQLNFTVFFFFLS